MKLGIDQHCETVKVERKPLPFDTESVRLALNENTHVEFRSGFDWVRIYSGSDGFSVSTWFGSYSSYEKFEDAWAEFESYVKGLMK
jgi:hypothetical protein